METILFQLVGVFIFALTTFLSGKLIRRKSNLEFARKPIRVVHFCYWFFLVLPSGLGLVYPGLLRLDTTLNVASFSEKPYTMIVGSIMVLIGMYYGFASSKLLAQIGRGAMAFKFSKRVVVKGVYNQVRNPMALGYYLMLLGIGLVAHSTYFFLFNLVIVIPVHIFYIKYFEEFEVALRLGKPYIQYKHKTPFLIPNFF